MKLKKINSWTTDFLSDKSSLDANDTPLPFVFKDNTSSIKQWAAKFQNFISTQESRILAIENAQRSVGIRKNTRLRFKKQLESEKQFLNQVRDLLVSFQFQTWQIDPKLAAENRIPTQQHIESYITNIFRDWAWGDAENKIYSDYLLSLKLKPKKILIVGGGSGRTLYDSAKIYPDAKVLQIDINPLLSLIGHKICSGEEVELMEIPKYGFDLESLSKNFILKAPAALNSKMFQFLLGDISDHPFKDEAFDLIICPWLIDILPETFDSLARRLNFLLEKNGHLVIWGPLSFQNQGQIAKTGQEEILEILQDSGFGDICHQSHRVPYLQSPIEPGHRSEKLLFLDAVKQQTTKKPAAFNSLPEWIRNPKNPPKLDQTMMARILGERNFEVQVLSSLYQGQSIENMAKLASSNGQISFEQAEALIIGVLIRLYENGLLK